MAILRCDKCQMPLPGANANTPHPVACPACQAATLVHVFPALAQPPARGRTAEALASEEDAGCFYHPRKKAVVPCDDCGRFLCALCDLEVAGRHVCPSCAETARLAGKGLRADSQRTLHDRLALTVLLSGVLLGVVTAGLATMVAAPVGLFLVVRHWHEPARSPVPRHRALLVFAGLLAVSLVAGWSLLLYRVLKES